MVACKKVLHKVGGWMVGRLVSVGTHLIVLLFVLICCGYWYWYWYCLWWWMLYDPSFRPKKCGMYFKFGVHPKSKFSNFVHKALLKKNASHTVPGTRGLYALQDAATQKPRLVLNTPEYHRPVTRWNHIPSLVWDTVSQGGKGECFGYFFLFLFHTRNSVW